MRLQSRRSARAGGAARTAALPAVTAAMIMALRHTGDISQIRWRIATGLSPTNGKIRPRTIRAPLFMNQRSRAEIGEQFQQHRMRHLAVEDHHALDPLV